MIPTVNFAALESGDAASLEMLRMAHRRVGTCYLAVDEVLGATEFSKVFSAAEAFFSLPDTVKKQLDIARSSNFRGYVGVGEEFTNGIADLKESFEFAKNTPAPARAQPPAYYAMYGDNQWPPNDIAPGFRSHLEHYLCAVERISRGVMCGLGLSLGLPNTPGTSTISDGLEACLFARAIHYEGLVGRTAETPRLEAHTDHVLLALIAESAPGLEIQTVSGNWELAVTRPGIMVVLLGELLEFWSRGYFRARPHRVLNGALNRKRISLTSFYLPHLDSTLEPWDAQLLAELRRRATDEPDEPAWRERRGDERLRPPSALDASGPICVGIKEWERLNNIFPEKTDPSEHRWPDSQATMPLR